MSDSVPSLLSIRLPAIVLVAIVSLGACSDSDDDDGGSPDPSSSDPDATQDPPVLGDDSSEPGSSEPEILEPELSVSAALIPEGGPLALTATIDSETSATISWEAPTAVTEDQPFAYEVRRDGVILREYAGGNSDDAVSTFYVDEFLVGGREYIYEVVAIAHADESRSAPSSITIRTAGGFEPATDGTPPDVNAENHAELLTYAFSVFNGSADGYGSTILALHGFSDPRYSEPLNQPEISDAPVEQVVCGNGGTAEFTPYLFGFQKVTTGWSSVFNNCQDGARVLDGDLERTVSSAFTVKSDRFSVVDQSRRLDYSGTLVWEFAGSRAYDSREWRLRDVYYTVTDAEEVVFELRDADAHLFTVTYSNSIDGHFRVRSIATRGKLLRVHVAQQLKIELNDGRFDSLEPPRFASGVLEIAGEDGSTLMLDADNGDIDTVEVTLRAGDEMTTLTQPWSIWGDQLLCYYNSDGPAADPRRGCLDPDG